MAVSVDIDLGYEFTVKAAFKDVFDVNSYPKSMSTLTAMALLLWCE